MFSETIDVAKIMREIKSEVIPEKQILLNSSEDLTEQLKAYDVELERISLFIENIGDEVIHSSIGENLPKYNRFAWPINKVLRLISKIVRKSIKFILNDQDEMNRKLSAISKAVKERQDIIIERQNLIAKRVDDLLNVTDNKTE